MCCTRFEIFYTRNIKQIRIAFTLLFFIIISKRYRIRAPIIIRIFIKTTPNVNLRFPGFHSKQLLQVHAIFFAPNLLTRGRVLRRDIWRSGSSGKHRMAKVNHVIKSKVLSLLFLSGGHLIYNEESRRTPQTKSARQNVRLRTPIVKMRF